VKIFQGFVIRIFPHLQTFLTPGCIVPVPLARLGGRADNHGHHDRQAARQDRPALRTPLDSEGAAGPIGAAAGGAPPPSPRPPAGSGRCFGISAMRQTSDRPSGEPGTARCRDRAATRMEPALAVDGADLERAARRAVRQAAQRPGRGNRHSHRPEPPHISAIVSFCAGLLTLPALLGMEEAGLTKAAALTL
jgi:hypothetical protein